MKGYKQLTKIQRYQIESLKKADMKQKDIALIIGVSGSALSRELSRNSGKCGYRPEQANTKALDRRKCCQGHKNDTGSLHFDRGKDSARL
jgi:IS30 family transposase